MAHRFELAAFCVVACVLFVWAALILLNPIAPSDACATSTHTLQQFDRCMERFQ